MMSAKRRRTGLNTGEIKRRTSLNRVWNPVGSRIREWSRRRTPSSRRMKRNGFTMKSSIGSISICPLTVQTSSVGVGLELIRAKKQTDSMAPGRGAEAFADDGGSPNKLCSLSFSLSVSCARCDIRSSHRIQQQLHRAMQRVTDQQLDIEWVQMDIGSVHESPSGSDCSEDQVD